MKVYVITRGSYSDYHICAVAVDKQHAEQLRKLFSNRYEDADIEEYDTDEVQTLVNGGARYAVQFNKNGNVSDIREDIDDYVGCCYLRHSGEFVVTVDAYTEEAAIKIAAEKRAQYLAEKLGL